MALDVPTLRALFKHLQAFRSVYETTGVDEITDPDGLTWTLWDLEYLHDQLDRLPPRQAQAIRLCLINNFKERDAAIAMGVSPENPVMMYSASGLGKLVDWVKEGRLPRFQDRYLAR